MRQLTTLPNADDARTLADYLLTLKIETRVDQQPEGWAVWVCDEDRLPQARQELEAFTQNPKGERYTTAARAAQTMRREEDRAEVDYARRQNELRQRMTERPPATRAYPATLFLIGISVLATLTSRWGDVRTSVCRKLFFESYEPVQGGILFQPGLRLQDVERGEVWRLVTPIFLHFNFMHLVFDMYALWIFGAAVELRRGSGRFLVLVLVIAVLSNTGQYYLGRFLRNGGQGPLLHPSPLFGGMSGVVYGLFGYVWMKSRFDPEAGLYIDATSVLMMMVWFFLCLFNLVGDIANVAHAVGLLTGIVIGYAPIWWHSLRG